MSDPSKVPEFVAQMTALWNHPAMQKCMSDITAVAGYRLTDDRRAPFLSFHRFITSAPEPTYIGRLRGSRWYNRHVDGVLGHVQNAVACVWYHHDNLRLIEDSVARIFVGSEAQSLLGDSTIGGGNTIRWDAEYQAFVLAVRRCLDYLARAIAAYFRNDHHSFRKMPSLLNNVKPKEVASEIRSVIETHIPAFEYVLSDGNKKSIRDLLSHYEYISAGVLNISRHGFVMAGGGEQLSVGKWEGGLGTVITGRAEHLQQCVAAVLEQFIRSAAAYERKETAA